MEAKEIEMEKSEMEKVKESEVKGTVEPRRAYGECGQGQYKSVYARALRELCDYIKEKYENAKIYKVIASKVEYVHKGDFIVETDDEVLLFSDDYFDENFFASYTEDLQTYEDSDYIVLVEKIECKVIEKIHEHTIEVEVQ